MKLLENGSPESVGGPPVTLGYVGKYQFGMDIGTGGSGVERKYLCFAPPYYITVGPESQAGTFALYGVTSSTSGRYMLQWTSTSDTPPTPPTPASGFIAITGGGDYPIAFPAHENDATQFTLEVQNDSCRLFIPDRGAYLLIARNPNGQIGFFTPKSPTMYDSARWYMRRVNQFGTDMSNADLRHVVFKKAAVAGVRFAGANLTRAGFSESQLYRVDFSGANCTNTNFANAMLADADFTGANLDGTTFAGTDTYQLKAPQTDFRKAALTAPAKFAHAKLAGAYFQKCDLTGVQFDEADLAGANFTESTLARTRFAKAHMERAILEKAKLQGAVLQEAVLTSAQGKRAELQGASFGHATLTDADLSDATFDANTDFRDATLFGVDFSGCRLDVPKFSATPRFYKEVPTSTPARLTRLARATVPLTLLGKDWSLLLFDNTTLQGVLPLDLTDFKANWTRFPDAFDLSGRTLDNAQFTHATLIKAKLANVRCNSERPVDFTGAMLREAVFTATVLPGAVFNAATLSGANMAASNMSGAQFKGAYLNSIAGTTPVTNLSNCNLRDADFSSAHLDTDGTRTGANMSYVRLYGSAKIANATLTMAVFTGAYLGGLDLSNIKDQAMRGVNFAQACLVNCKFNGSALTDCILNDACLYGADFSDAQLYGAQLDNAWVATNEQDLTLKLIGLPLPSVTYKRTVINGDKTNSGTSCPNQQSGPCTDAASWRRAGGLPTEWRYKGQVLRDEEDLSG